MTPEQKLATARAFVEREAGYITSAVLAMTPQEAPGLGTFGVTQSGFLMYDPAKVAEWSVAQIAAVLVHEAWHLLRDHAARGKACGADHAGFNAAGDREINDDLEGHWELPPGYLHPRDIGQPEGKLAEEYYAADRDEDPQGPDGDGESTSGEGEGEGNSGDNEPQSQDTPPEPQPEGDADPESNKSERQWGGRCGSAAGGEPLPGEPAADAEGAKTADEIDMVRQEVAEQIRAEAQKGRGNMPAGITRWADDVLKPAKIRWQDKLARLVRCAIAYRAGAIDYKFSRLSRRQWGIGIGAGKPMLPGLVSPVPNVTLAVDTSGSMGGAELERALSEATGILAAVGSSVEFLACDAEVQAVERCATVKDMAANLKGGGGTSFVPIFDHVAKQRNRPDVVIVVTDGEGYPPEVAPAGIETVWVLVGPYQTDRYIKQWGTVIPIEEN